MENICAEIPVFLMALNMVLDQGAKVIATMPSDSTGLFTITSPTMVTEWVLDYGSQMACKISEDKVMGA